MTLKASIVLSMEGLSLKLRPLFDPLMFDHGTLVSLASSHFYLYLFGIVFNLAINSDNVCLGI